VRKAKSSVNLCAPSPSGVLKFLQRLDAEFAGGVELHVVMDNYGTHKHPRVQRWLKRHERFIPHLSH